MRYVRHFQIAVPDMNRSTNTARQLSAERHERRVCSCAGAVGAVCGEREGHR